MAQTISFEELSAGLQSAPALRTALNKLAATLTSVGNAGAGAQEMLRQLQTDLRATAAASGKTVRALAKFDEINRLAAPRTTTQDTANTSGKQTAASKTSREEQPAVWQKTLDALRGAWASFWAYLQQFYAPAIAAWQAAWQQICDAALRVWEPIRAAALGLWQGLMEGIAAGWAAYGQPLLDGTAQAVQGLCELLTGLWASVVQPVLVQAIALADQLWTGHLKPLWDNLVLALGSVMNLVLTVWNTVLQPLLNWLITSFGPVFTQVFGLAAQAVTAAVGVVADCVNVALIALRGVADFVSLTLLGRWTEAWQAMSATVSAIWQQIIATVRGAVNAVVGLVRSMASVVSGIVGGIVSAIGSAGSGLSALSAPVLGRSVSVRVPALASGAVIPPNREFLALLGDQRTGTNIEAPLDTIKQAFAETLSAMGGGDGQPINIYLGEELLDSVIANSQQRRLLRSGGR